MTIWLSIYDFLYTLNRKSRPLSLLIFYKDADIHVARPTQASTPTNNKECLKLAARVNRLSSDIACKLITCYVLVCTAHRSNNFIVGLTNVSPLDSTPTLWQYTLCGQYPGAVAPAATVFLYCPYNLPLFRYVIVQFPRTDLMNICELEVIAPGECLWHVPSIWCFTDWC